MAAPTGRGGSRCGCVSAAGHRAGRRQQDRPRGRALRDGLAEVDPLRVATKTISGLYDGATTAELDRLSIQTAAELIGEEPEYSRLAARLLSGYIDKEVRGQEIRSFSQSIAARPRRGLIGDATAAFVAANARKLDDAVDPARRPRSSTSACARSTTATCCGTRRRRLVLETPQYFLLRVACGLARTPARGDRALPADVEPGVPAELADAVQLGHRAHPDVVVLPARLACATSWTRSTSATREVAKLSKFAGGIGMAFTGSARGDR